MILSSSIAKCTNDIQVWNIAILIYIPLLKMIKDDLY